MNVKQNPTKDHHYVPVCYLRQFLDHERGCVLSLNLEYMRLGYKVKPKWFAPRQFCYIEDYYTISEEMKAEFKDFNVYQALHIESDLFGILENRFHDFIRLMTRDRIVPVADAIQIADFIVQMKLRNPYWLQGMAGKSQLWIDKIYPKLAQEFLNSPKFLQYSTELKLYALQKELDRTRKSPLLNKRLQLHSLIYRNTTNLMGINENFDA